MALLAQCVHRDAYITMTQKDLDMALDQALRDVRETLHEDADFMRDTGFESYWDWGIMRPLSPHSNRIVELDPFLYDQHTKKPRSRGAYKTSTGRTFLKRGEWCRKTLLHEILHAISIFAIETRIGGRYPFLREGLTEFLAGYVMWRRYTSCYEAWRRKTYRWCRISSYEDRARLWYTFCRFVNLREVVKLFCGNGIRDWTRLWQNLLARIPQVGRKRFRDPIRMRDRRLEDRFRRECIRYFGKDFRRIYMLESREFDYSLLRTDEDY